MSRTEIVTLQVEHEVAISAQDWDWPYHLRMGDLPVDDAKVLGRVEVEADVEVGDLPTDVPSEFEAKGLRVPTMVVDADGGTFVKADTDDMCWIYVGESGAGRTAASWYSYTDLSFPLTVLHQS